jgi:hypothetical protein
VFVDARDCAGATAMQTKGDKYLANLIQTETIAFGVSQNPGCYYGVDYFLGDRVSWGYAGASGQVLIDSVTVESVKDTPEKITVGLKNENG